MKIVAELAAIHGVSKGGLSKTLKALHDKGLLSDALVDAPSSIGYERQVRHAFEKRAFSQQTPYGTMLCEMDLPVNESTKKNTRPTMFSHPAPKLPLNRINHQNYP